MYDRMLDLFGVLSCDQLEPWSRFSTSAYIKLAPVIVPGSILGFLRIFFCSRKLSSCLHYSGVFVYRCAHTEPAHSEM